MVYKVCFLCLGAFLTLMLASSTVYGNSVEQKMCLIMPEEPVDSEIFSEYDGHKIQFCCKKCRRQFDREPQAWVSKISDAEVNMGLAEKTAPTILEEPAAAVDFQESNASIANAATPTKKSPAVVRLAGKMHPLVIHFPIALVFTAFLAEGMAILTKAKWCNQTAMLCIGIAAAGAIASGVFGWAASTQLEVVGDDIQRLWLHKAFALSSIGMTLVSSAAALFHYRHKESNRAQIVYRILLVVTVATTSIAGHFGGELVHGPII
jgi:uncharacterized membrane protein/YHS domain-containing protein